MFEMSMTPEMSMRVTPALLNLAHLLTLPSLALHQMVQQELVENPALEEFELEEPNADALLDDQFDVHSDVSGKTQSGYTDDDEFDALMLVAAPRNMEEGLLADLCASLPEHEHLIAQMLVGSLNDQGFLSDDLGDIAATLKVSQERVTAVLERLRELGPPGIATRTIPECLLAQIDTLAVQGITCPHARVIIEHHFDDLGAHRHTHIARALQISSDDVQAVRDFIQQHLWPYPAQAGAAGSTPNRVQYRQADLAISRQRDDTFTVDVLHSPRRMVRINPLYRELASQSAQLEAEERAHVQEYVARARTFLANLRQRESTLKRIGDVLVVRQEDFLRHGPRHLVPLTRAEIAAELGLHESTVSRAIAEKVALLPDRALLPLSEFFMVARGVQDVLRELIANETKPLSDAELARQLHAQGYSIARRTVTKYREQMKILPSHLR